MTTRSFIRTLGLVLLATLTCLQAQPQAPAKNDLKLKAGDQLNLTMLRHDDMTQNITIGVDGTAVFKLINQVQLAGLTVQQAKESIQTAYKEFFVNPQITLTPGQMADALVKVLGSVNNPKDIIMRRGFPIDVTAAIQEAGGLNGHADASNIQLTRKNQQPKRFNLAALMNPKNKRIMLEDGDQIVVGVHPNAGKVVSIIGEVTKPGNYPIPMNRKMTIEELVGKAFGFTLNAHKAGIRVIRGGREFGTGRAGLKAKLSAGDTVKVPVHPNVGKFVTMSGRVTKPGKLAFPIQGGLTVTQAIAEAGGPARFGDISKVTISRKIGGKAQTIPVNAKKIRAGKNPNVPLIPGDTVHIGERKF